MDNVLEYLERVIPELQVLTADDIGYYVVERILASPYDRASLEQIYNIVEPNYYPGLFRLNERSEAPGFLLEESEIPFAEWLFLKFSAEIEQLCKDKTLNSKIDKVGVEALIKYCIDVLYLKNKQGICLVNLIPNQEYSDIFRRIVMFLLTGNSFTIFNNHLDFNKLGKKVALNIIKMTKQYSLRKRLFQSIASGLIGMDIKESNISTAPISLDSSLILKGRSIGQIVDGLDTYINNSSKIGIDCFKDYYNEVIRGYRIHIAWFTDDYIQTIFELKFIEEQMNVNKTLSFTIVPRYDSYSNDASYNDILEFLDLGELHELKEFYRTGRLSICRNGMDISTVDFMRMSSELYDIIQRVNVCVVSGARAFEMTQGINKTVYYTGIAVCKSYTESITGFSRNSGKLIFLRQDSGEHSFEGFRDRAWRRILDGNEMIPAAKITAKEYCEEKYDGK